MKDKSSFPSMLNVQHTSKQALIIGAFDGIGKDFAKMAAVKGKQLILIDSEDESLKSSKTHLLEEFPTLNVKAFSEELAGFDTAENIYDAIQFSQVYSDTVKSIDMIINIIEFQYFDIDDEDADWESLGKNLDLYTLKTLNNLFATQMMQDGKGEILNVITGPKTMSGKKLEHFKDTESMLMTFSKDLHAKVERRGVSIHALSYSGSGLIFLSPDATAAPGPAAGSYAMNYVQQLLSTMS